MGIEPANEAFDGLESQIKLEFTHHKDHFFFFLLHLLLVSLCFIIQMK